MSSRQVLFPAFESDHNDHRLAPFPGLTRQTRVLVSPRCVKILSAIHNKTTKTTHSLAHSHLIHGSYKPWTTRLLQPCEQFYIWPTQFHVLTFEKRKSQLLFEKKKAYFNPVFTARSRNTPQAQIMLPAKAEASQCKTTPWLRVFSQSCQCPVWHHKGLITRTSCLREHFLKCEPNQVCGGGDFLIPGGVTAGIDPHAASGKRQRILHNLGCLFLLHNVTRLFLPGT